MVRPTIVPFGRLILDDSPGRDDLTPLIAAGDVTATQQFYDATSALAFGLALRVADDEAIARQACESAYAALPSLARTPGAIRPDLQTAFLGLVRETTLASIGPANKSTSGEPASYNVAKVIRETLESMDPLARRALKLAYFGGLDIRAISEILGTPAAELRPILRDALLHLGAATRIQENAR